MTYDAFQSAIVPAENPDVFITAALDTRIPTKVDYQNEKLALQALMSSMAA